jgi:serine/threonine-protein kinase
VAEPAVALTPVRRIGRYDLHEEIASGGMATVYLGRLAAATGFSRPVAVKRLHDNLATDPQFVSMLLDEARLTARVRHPNVVATLDVVEAEREVVVVMEYVHGESLAVLRKITQDRGERIPSRIAATIVAGALHGLHAAHEAVDEQGDPLHIVHRDVSPQNILVGVDGVPRVLDFGIAKAAGRMQTTQDGKLKGKFGYMAPEQLKAIDITARADVYAAAVVFWEALTGQRLYPEDADAATILTKVLFEDVARPSTIVSGLPDGGDEVVMKGLAKDPEQRYASALEMATEIERVFGVASPTEVATYVKEVAKEAIRRKSESLAVVERADTDAGQKRRREVVARVASGLSERPGAPPRASRPWLIAVAFVAVAAAGGFFVLRKPPSAAPVETTADKPAPPNATTATAPIASPPPPPTATATAAPPVASSEAPTPPVASGVSIAQKGLPAGKKPGKKVDPKSPPDSAVAATPTPTPPPATAASAATEHPGEDAGRDLIPKFRK